MVLMASSAYVPDFHFDTRRVLADSLSGVLFPLVFDAYTVNTKLIPGGSELTTKSGASVVVRLKRFCPAPATSR